MSLYWHTQQKINIKKQEINDEDKHTKFHNDKRKLGIINPDPNSVGVHNFADWFPTIILNMGTLLWLALMIPVHRGIAEVRTVSNQ